MIDELAECRQYLAQYSDIREILKDRPCAGCKRRLNTGYTFECEACGYFNDANRRLDSLYKDKDYRFISHYFPSPGRVLRVLARYWLFHDPEISAITDIKQKTGVIGDELFEFYCDVILFSKVPYASLLKGKLNAKFMEDLYEDAGKPKDRSFNKFAQIACDALGKTARYVKPFLEQRDNAFTFFSVTADAMNAGPLAAGAAVTVKAAEIAYLLDAADYGKNRGKPDITTPTLALSLICLYRAASGNQKLPGGYLPIVMEDLNAWLGNTKAAQKRYQWGENAAFDFLPFINISNSLRYKVDEPLLAQMTESIKTGCPDFIITDAGGNIKGELYNSIKIVLGSS